MSQIRLYLDEDATHNRLLQALHNRGVDVISTATAGQISQSDEDQLAWALRDRRVIYSFNVRVFYRLHKERLEQNQPHAGIILSRQNYSIGDLSQWYIPKLLGQWVHPSLANLRMRTDH